MLYYFRSSASFVEPLVAPVASLLFWSRRELDGALAIPTALPRTRASIGGSPGLTQEDLIEYNAHKSARLPNTVIWDWERGCPIRRAEDGTTSDWPDQDSERWDIDWWRARLCDGVFLKQPKFRLGPVYIRGILTGLWQGVQFVRHIHWSSIHLFDMFAEPIANELHDYRQPATTPAGSLRTEPPLLRSPLDVPSEGTWLHPHSRLHYRCRPY